MPLDPPPARSDTLLRRNSVCERRKRAAEALACNALVQSRPEITGLAREGVKPKTPEQGELL